MKPVVLVVLDGLGIRAETADNAFAQADTPVLDAVFETYPYTELAASGEAVGLPDGYIGNSEVGHLHIGAGRSIPQELVRINAAIADGAFQHNAAFEAAVDHVETTGGVVHVMGIASDGGVHGHIDHLIAAMDVFTAQSCTVKVHAFLDGRDVRPKNAAKYLTAIEEAADGTTAELASLMGRFYAMDRDHNWDRTHRAYDCLTGAEAHRYDNHTQAIEERYQSDKNDYFIAPSIIDESFAPVTEDDAVVFVNYRKDRARQLAGAFLGHSDVPFETPTTPGMFVSMFQYRDDFTNPTVFDEQLVSPTLGDAIAAAGYSQCRITESQKEPHVTYFLNGQREPVFEGEDVIVHDSADVASYDEKPEMEAAAITDSACDAIDAEDHELLFINYPNCDLVGHTGDLDAAITAVETVDRCLGRLQDAAAGHGYVLMVTADHGNCEDMAGRWETSHTLNPVPFCYIDPDQQDTALLPDAGLVNIAATVLDCLGIEAPDEFEPGLVR